jgi:hypothetical protein
LDALTRSSSERNGRAWVALLLALLSVAALPVAIALAEVWRLFDLLEAAVGVPVAAFLAVVALALARSARRRVERTLGRVGGAGVARAARGLAALGIALALSGAIAVGFYALLTHLAA